MLEIGPKHARGPALGPGPIQAFMNSKKRTVAPIIKNNIIFHLLGLRNSFNPIFKK
jgi:hypothetical protein